MKSENELTRAPLLLPNLPIFCNKSKKIQENPCDRRLCLPRHEQQVHDHSTLKIILFTAKNRVLTEYDFQLQGAACSFVSSNNEKIKKFFSLFNSELKKLILLLRPQT
jgi:hypothetical protein